MNRTRRYHRRWNVIPAGVRKAIIANLKLGHRAPFIARVCGVSDQTVRNIDRQGGGR